VHVFTHCVDQSLLVAEPCDGMQRLGSANDGGYVVALETIRSARHLLSFGLATNWDFERDAVAVNPSLTIEAFDPSVDARRFAGMAVRSAISAPLRLAVADVRGAASSFRRARTAVDYFRFFSRAAKHTSKRVWYNADRDSVPIGDIIASVRASRRAPVFAKIDIEGSEYRILPWIAAAADLFTGMVIEFHDTDICANLFNAQVALLLDAFTIAHVHGNNHGDLAVDGSLPLTLEITFVHRSIATRSTTTRSSTRSLAHLDAPNDPRRPDYVLDLTARRSVSRSLAVCGSSV
jgi:hypothetical protein